MFGIGTGELLLIAFIALLVLGPERMPQLMRDVGKAMTDLRKTSDELQQEFMNADRKLSAEKLLDVATRPALSAPEPTTQAEVATPAETATATAETATAATATAETTATADATTPPPIQTEPEETAFDREARLARERIDRMG